MEEINTESDFDTDNMDISPGLERLEANGDGWRQNVPDQYRRVADKFKSPEDVVQSYAELERKLGNAVELPRDGDDRQRDALFDRLGRPESPEGYDIKLPENLPQGLTPSDEDFDRQNRFLTEAHRIGLSSDQAQAAIDWYYGELQQQAAANKNTDSEYTADLTAQLRKEWGRDYEKNIEFGSRALSTFGDPETLDQLENIIGSAPVVRMMARIGRSMGEAGTHFSNVTGKQASSLQEELDRLVSREDYWHNDDIQRRVRDLNVRIHGTKKVVGTTPDRNL